MEILVSAKKILVAPSYIPISLLNQSIIGNRVTAVFQKQTSEGLEKSRTRVMQKFSSLFIPFFSALKTQLQKLMFFINLKLTGKISLS